MYVAIRKNPSKITLFGALGLLLAFGLASLLIDDVESHYVLIFGLGIALLFLLIKSFAAPYFPSVEIKNGRIEAITGLGGLITIPLSEIDHERSSLTSLGLEIVPHSGESLFLSATEYSREDLLQVAHYAGVCDFG